jgi:hypothetical protein
VIIGKEFKRLNAKLTDAEKKARLDIRYQTAAGKHIVVELKKYDRKVKAIELVEQLDKYRGALLKVLKDLYPNEPQQIEFICLVGSRPAGSDPKAVEKMLASVDARFITYETLLKQTRQSYGDYLESQAKIDRIHKLVESI